MKRFLLPSIFFFTILLFLFISKVYADTPSYDIDINQYDLIGTEFNALKSFADNYISQNSSYNSYRIFVNTSGLYQVYISRVSAVSRTVTYTSWTSSGNTIYGFAVSQALDSQLATQIYKYQDGEVVFSTSGQYSSLNVRLPVNDGVVDFRNLLYLYWKFANNSPRYYFTSYSNYDFVVNNSYTFHAIQNGQFPCFYDIYQSYSPPPPTPSDNTPLLTSFFTLTIEKLQFVTEYFSSNYIYLSIFAIFILIFFLYLIKRRLF